MTRKGARRPKEIRGPAAHSQPWGQIYGQNWPGSSEWRPELGGRKGPVAPSEGEGQAWGEDSPRAGALVRAQQTQGTWLGGTSLFPRGAGAEPCRDPCPQVLFYRS